jgi:hypothetical protein
MVKCCEAMPGLLSALQCLNVVSSFERKKKQKPLISQKRSKPTAWTAAEQRRRHSGAGTSSIISRNKPSIGNGLRLSRSPA